MHPTAGGGEGDGSSGVLLPQPRGSTYSYRSLAPDQGPPLSFPLGFSFLSDPEVSQSPPTPGSSWATLGEQGLPESRGSRSHVFPLPLGDNSPWVSVLAL